MGKTERSEDLREVFGLEGSDCLGGYWSVVFCDSRVMEGSLLFEEGLDFGYFWSSATWS